MSSHCKTQTQKAIAAHNSSGEWSVKSPNQFNIPENIRTANDSAELISKSNTSGRQSRTDRPNDLKKQVLTKQREKQTSPQNVFQSESTSARVTDERLHAKLDATRQRVELTAKLSPKRPPAASVINSHIPNNALNYLQLVDEPGLGKVVSKFHGHSFKTNFGNPLKQHTLYLAHLQEDHRTRPRPTFWPMTQTASMAPRITTFINELSSQGPQSRNDKRRNFFSTDVQNTTQSVQRTAFSSSGRADISVIGGQNPARSILRTQQASVRPRKYFAGASNAARAKQGRSGSLSNRGHVPPSESRGVSTNIGHDASGQIKKSLAVQDSIESSNWPTRREFADATQVEAARQHFNEVIHYHVDKHSYQPFFKERRDQQNVRKRQLIKLKQQQFSLDYSIFSSRSEVRGAVESVHLSKQLGKASHYNAALGNKFQYVLGSALRVRDLKNKKDGKAGPSKESVVVHQFEPRLLSSRASNAKGRLKSLGDRSMTITPATIPAFMTFQAHRRQRPSQKLDKNAQTAIDEVKHAHEEVKQRSRMRRHRAHLNESPIDVKIKYLDEKNMTNTMTMTDSGTHSNVSNKQSKAETLSKNNSAKIVSLKASVTASVDNQSSEHLQGGALLVKRHIAEEDESLSQPYAGQKGRANKTGTAMHRSNDLSTESHKSKPRHLSGMSKDYNAVKSGHMTIKKSTHGASRQSMKELGKSSYSQYSKQSKDKHMTSSQLIKYNLKLRLSNQYAAKQDEVKTAELKQKSINAKPEVDQNSAGTDQVDVLKSSAAESNQNNEVAQLAKIDQPKAQVEIKDGVGSMRSSNDFGRESVGDYEEFRQAGIISQKFAYQDGQLKKSGTGSNFERGSSKLIPSISHSKHSQVLARLKRKAILDRSADINTVLSRRSNSRSPTKLSKLSHRLSNNDPYKRHSQLSKSSYNRKSQVKIVSLEDQKPVEYLITRYSLPRALVGSRNDQGRAHSLNVSTIPKKRTLEPESSPRSPVSFEMEQTKDQFVYDREQRANLVGPQGKKLSHQMAKSITHARQRRKATEQISEVPAEVEPNGDFRDLQLTCRGGTVSTNSKVDQTTSIEKGGQFVSLSKEENVASRDLTHVIFSEDKECKAITARRRPLNVQLNKVNLHFNMDAEGPFAILSPNEQLSGLRGSSIRMLPGQNKQTRMISIDVQTDIKMKKGTPMQSIRSKLKIVNQERSIQETLYDGNTNEMLGSQCFILSSNDAINESAVANSHDYYRIKTEKTKKVQKLMSNPMAGAFAESVPSEVTAHETRMKQMEGRGGFKQISNSQIIDTQEATEKGDDLPLTAKIDDSQDLPTTQDMCNSDEAKFMHASSERMGMVARDSKQQTRETLLLQHEYGNNPRRHEEEALSITTSNQSPSPKKNYLPNGVYTGKHSEQDRQFRGSLKIESQEMKLARPGIRACIKRTGFVTQHTNQVTISNRDLSDVKSGRGSTRMMAQRSTVAQKVKLPKEHSQYYLDKNYDSNRANLDMMLKQLPFKEVMDGDTGRVLEIRYSSEKEARVPSRAEKSQPSRAQQHRHSSLSSQPSLSVDNDRKAQEVVKKILNGRVSEYSSDYVPVQMQVHDAKDITSAASSSNGASSYREQQLSRNVYMKSVQRSAHSQKRDSTHLSSRNEKFNSNISQKDAQSIDKDDNSLEDPQQYFEEVDKNWLEKFCSFGENNHTVMQNRREAQLALRERLLMINQARLCRQRPAKQLSAISANKLLERPSKSYSRTQIGKLGKCNDVETIWAHSKMMGSQLAP